ncbi:MAG: DUF3616 domain-containing protein [Prevotella sp.]|nr:DUF3616 domain-containing protein [Prevotella sp.]
MKTPLLTFILAAASMSTLSAATLEASSSQALYPGTSAALLNIVSGSGKTSYVSGVIDDPTDPAATVGIRFNAPTGSTLTFKSSNTSVVKVSDITAEEVASGVFAVRIKPSGVGFAKITVSLSGASDYTIQYAASKASTTPNNTVWLHGSCDASAMAEVGDGYFYVADDENNILRLYSSQQSGMPLRTVDTNSFANGSSSDEYDIEGATVSNDGQTIYWLTSLSNSKKGKEKPYRNRAFSTKINGSGATATLTSGAYSEQFRDAMIQFGDNNGWNFTASASFADKMIPKRIDGFNIEGLTLKTGTNGAAYVGFRAPCVPKKGVTPTSSNRKYAVLATVTNFEYIFSGSGKSSTTPQVGAPVLFDFGGLGIRSIERVGDYYVIIAGLFEGGGTPKAYLWDGTTNANADPITVSGGHLTEMALSLENVLVGGDGHPEALTARQEGNQLFINLVSDCGSADMYNDGSENKTFSADSNKNPWAKFRLDTFVYSLPQESAVNNIQQLQPLFTYSVNGGVLSLGRLSAGTAITLATADGKIIANQKATGSSLSLPLPTSGTYILKVGKQSVKLITSNP